MADLEPKHSTPLPRGAGGTPGGIGTFFLGLGMVVLGSYLLLNQVTVTGGFGVLGLLGGGARGFGLTLLPLLAGIGFLFFDGKSMAGWILLGVGSVIILGSILMNMSMVFRQTSLFNVLVMLGLLFGGLGVIARSLRPYADPPRPGA